MALRHVMAEAADKLGLPEGVSCRPFADDPLPGPGPDGQPAEWTLAAYAYLGLVDSFLKPDPDFRAPGSLNKSRND